MVAGGVNTYAIITSENPKAHDTLQTNGKANTYAMNQNVISGLERIFANLCTDVGTPCWTKTSWVPLKRAHDLSRSRMFLVCSVTLEWENPLSTFSALALEPLERAE